MTWFLSDYFIDDNLQIININLRNIIAIFASGSGSNFQAIAEAINNKTLDATIALLVCDKADAKVLQRAESLGIESMVFIPKDYKSKEHYEMAIVAELQKRDVELICLAGYMRICGEVLLGEYPNRIINIHPSLLPSFKGAHAIQDAFDFGVKVFGVTVHLIDNTIDGGVILSQRAFEYYGDDINEVEEIIHVIEHELYPETLAALVS